jgi:hypothetical protein
MSTFGEKEATDLGEHNLNPQQCSTATKQLETLSSVTQVANHCSFDSNRLFLFQLPNYNSDSLFN